MDDEKASAYVGPQEMGDVLVVPSLVVDSLYLLDLEVGDGGGERGVLVELIKCLMVGMLFSSHSFCRHAFLHF